MKRWLLIICFIAALLPPVMAQRQRMRGAKFRGSTIYKGDTIDHFAFAPIYVFDKPKDFRRYQRLVDAVRKVYPLAQIARAKMADMEEQLLSLSKREQRAYINKCYKDIIHEYTPVAKRMTRTQGWVLIKLIDRQTDYTAYEIIREFRGGFVASFWQGVGKLFGHDLKSEYDKENDDKLLEQIIVYYEAGLL